MTWKPASPPRTLDADISRYLSDELNRAAVELDQLARATLEVFVAKGYGGIHLDTASAGNDLGAGFIVVDGFQSSVPEPVDVSTNTGAGQFISIDRVGHWLFNISIVFEHNELNASRETQLQIWDSNDLEALGVITIGTGRNVAYSSVSVGFLNQFPESKVGNAIQLRLGGGGTYTAVNWETLVLHASHVSELQN